MKASYKVHVCIYCKVMHSVSYVLSFFFLFFYHGSICFVEILVFSALLQGPQDVCFSTTEVSVRQVRWHQYDSASTDVSHNPHT